MRTETGSVKKGTRIHWIDGLRGIGCLCIFFHHFCLKYYPATYWGPAEESRIRWGLDAKLANMPFVFVINGNFWVCVYLLLCGMVVVNKTLDQMYGHRLTYYLRYFVKRYFTLVLPIFIAEMLMFAGSRLFPAYVIPDIRQTIPFFHFLKSTFWSVLFVCDTSVLGSLWTMQAIFLGGLIVLLIHLLFQKRIVKILLLLLVMVLFLRTSDHWYFAPVMAGGIFWLLFPEIRDFGGCPAGVVSFIIGCFLAAYPSGLVPESGVYGLLPAVKYGPFFYHFIGAILFVYGIARLQVLRTLFGCRAARWLGRIAYPFYVLHGFFIKLMGVVFAGLSKGIASYSLRVGICAVLALAFCLIASWCYASYLEPRWNKIIKKIA
ncbi:MAG: acyltransferase family protein [Lachnospiraceae bacterium]|nr:acyltransferase family protein [Lachnospiraceae bacterium]